MDCARAKTITETAICASPELQEIDNNLNATYRPLKTRLPPAQFTKVREEQIAWLKGNDEACKGDAACLKARYNERLKSLVDLKTDAPPPQATGTLSYKIVTIQKESPYELNRSFPQFSGPDTEKAAKLNGFIAKFAKGCEIHKIKDQWQIEASHFSSDISVLALNDDTAVIRETYDVNCLPAAHPDYGTETYFVSPRTGTAIDLWETMPDAGRKIVAQRIAKAAALNIPNNDECRDSFSIEALNDTLIAVGYKGDNLFSLQPRLAHAAQACEDRANATIAAQELQKLYPPESEAYKLLEALKR
jgi:hypothetical protein